MARSHPAGARRGRRQIDPVPAHPFVGGVDGRCTACRLPQERTDVHGPLPTDTPDGGDKTGVPVEGGDER